MPDAGLRNPEEPYSLPYIRLPDAYSEPVYVVEGAGNSSFRRAVQ